MNERWGRMKSIAAGFSVSLKRSISARISGFAMMIERRRGNVLLAALDDVAPARINYGRFEKLLRLSS